MTRTGSGASPQSETAVHWLPERLGDNADESAASGPGPEKLQDHAGDERDDASEEQPGMGLSEAIDLVDLVGVLGHVGKRCIVLIERSDLGDTDTADGVFDLSLQPDLLGALQIARYKRDFAAHLTVAAKPFKRDERKPKAIEEEPDDLEPLLVRSILDATIGNGRELRLSLSTISGHPWTPVVRQECNWTRN